MANGDRVNPKGEPHVPGTVGKGYPPMTSQGTAGGGSRQHEGRGRKPPVRPPQPVLRN
jgi:hypothetical protein